MTRLLNWLRRLLGAMSHEEMNGIRLDHPAWAIAGVEPSRVFPALLELAPKGALLFLEGGQQQPDLLAFLEKHKQSVSPRPALGTLWPRHSWFIIPADPDVLSELGRLTARLACPEVCDHLHVFLGECVLLEGHDAFLNDFLVSDSVSEEQVKRFCAATGSRYERVAFARENRGGV
jgi:hypothetical protein